MKTPRIANAIGQIDDDLVAGAAKCKTTNKKHWLKWGSLASIFLFSTTILFYVVMTQFQLRNKIISFGNALPN